MQSDTARVVWLALFNSSRAAWKDSWHTRKWRSLLNRF